MTDLITTPIDELATRVKLIERAALAIRIIADAGPVTLPETGEAEKTEDKPAPKKRAPRKKKTAAKPDPKPEEQEEQEEQEEEEEQEEDLIGDGEEEEEVPEISQQDVIDLARKVVSAKKQDVLKKLTTKLKIDKIRNAKTKDYALIVETLQAALD